MYTSLPFKRLFLPLVMVAVLFTGAGCDSNDDEEELQDIVGVATASGFTTLVAAIEAADLTETLQGAGPFTVFAPTEAAFAALPAGTLDTLLDPANQATLAGILTYHVVSGEVTAAQVVTLTSATTVNGATVAISVVDGAVFINDAEVTTTDIEASNGVIHIIDAVLLPPAGN
ncbi:MAG: fasciclin domain-containing protein [Rhodothermales bacterium]|nr:fasciclin domain-containing protein [Rhodothermales bacterium]